MKNLITFAVLLIPLLAQVPSLDTQSFRSFDTSPYITPTSVPAKSVTINWNTHKAIASAVAYGTSPLLKDTIYYTNKVNHHHVILNNLLPGTEYYYKILPDGNIHKFKTFPEKADSLFFIVFGDTRSDSASHQAVIDQISNYSFDFLIHSGDLVSKGYKTDDWKTFFNIEGKLLADKVFVPTIGNHEKPFWQYDTLFSLPGLEDFYSVRCANVCIICLNTEMDLDGIQKKWLINELRFISKDTTIDWIFVNLHRPPYSSGSHGSALDVRQQWCPIFEEHKVDIVFCGHDHSYERTKKINGVIYIVCAGGGAPLYDVGMSEWTTHSEKTHHFCLVSIRNRQMKLQAIKPDGTVFDSLVIKK